MRFNKVESIKYINPFGEGGEYDRRGVGVFENEYGKIVKVFDAGGTHAQHDYVINGVCITQRVGASEKLLEILAINGVKPKEYTRMYELIKGVQL